jgi:predicted NAD/FAD-dependent oxidoreductase
LHRLRTYRIPHALPDQPTRSGRRAAETTVDGLYVCGDGGETASIHGAMLSGRVAAEAVAAALAP